MNIHLRAPAALVALVAASGLLAAQPADEIVRTVYITAVDDRGDHAGRGNFITDLKLGDITVKEGGKERPVVELAPTQDRLKIAVAVEEMLAPDRVLRLELSRFIAKLQAYGDIALYMVGQRAEKRADYTSDLTPLIDAINNLPPRAVNGGNFVASIHEIAKDQRTVEGRRAIVVLAVEVTETGGINANTAIAELRAARSALFAVTFPGPPNPTERSEATSAGRLLALENQAASFERDRVFTEGTRESGGALVPTHRYGGITGALDRVLLELRNEYAVTYTMPLGTRSDGKLAITSKLRGVTIRYPRQLPRL